MDDEKDRLGSLCRQANPDRGECGRDLEAELLKAQLRARLLGTEPLDPPVLGRFELLRRLGRGGMGSVFAARDRQDGSHVALKVLHTHTDAALTQLRQEFRSLARLTHPNLITLGELHELPGPPFFTMQLIAGESLQALLARARTLGCDEILRYLLQLLAALVSLHEHGVVHGDIKPSNLLLSPEGRLVVVDFGVARLLRAEPLDPPAPAPYSNPEAGTRAYMAPERRSGGPATPAGDWYAVGAVLKEMLAVASPGGSARDGLAVLPRLCAALQHEDPSRRPRGHEVAKALGQPLPDIPWLAAPQDEEVFVGRSHELAVLLAGLAATVHGPQIVRIHGEPGMGKTALLAEFEKQAVRAGALVLGGRCYEAEVIRYKGFERLIEWLAERPQGELGARLRADEVGALVDVFPSLSGAAQEPVGQRSARTDTRALRQVAFDALAGELRGVAQQRPLVLLLDDLQWLDPDGEALLAHVLLNPPSASLFVFSHRHDWGPVTHQALGRAMALHAQQALPLGPLPIAEATDLMQRLSGGVLPSGYGSLLEAAAGNPLLLRALLRAKRPTTPGTCDFADWVEQVRGRLDKEARNLLDLLAVAGAPVAPDLLARAARGFADEVWLAVAQLKGLGMVRVVDRAGQRGLATYHDRVREAVVAGLGTETRRSYHFAWAVSAEALSLDAAEFVAEHYFRAGENAQAAPHAERAGDRAREVAALRQACMFYDRALVCRAPARPLALVVKLADSAALLGDVQRAGPLFLEAADQCGDRQGLAIDYRLRAAEMYLFSGDAPRGLQLLRPALRRRGIWLPGSELGAMLCGALGFIQMQIQLALHQVSKRWDARAGRTGGQDSLVELVVPLGFTLALNRPTHAAALLLWCGQRALRRGSHSQRGRALALLAHVEATLGMGSEASQDGKLAAALDYTQDEPTARAHVLCCRALIDFSRQDCRRTLASLQAAQHFVLQERVAVDWVVGPLQAVRACSLVMAGDFCRLQAEAEEVLQWVTPLKNRAVLTQIQSAHAWGRLAHGDVAGMASYTHGAMVEWRQQRSAPLYALAVWGEAHRLLYVGEVAAALRLMQREARGLEWVGIGRIHAWVVALALLWGTIALAGSQRPGDQNFRVAAAQLKRLRRQRARWAAPAAALLAAGMARHRGAPQLALRHYAEARQAFTRLGLAGYAAAAEYREQVIMEGDDQRAPALPWFVAQHVADPGRWTRMYAP